MSEERYQDQVATIEANMQQAWKAEGLDATDLDAPADRPHRYVLGMFPYPSGNAHLGHVLVFTLSDALARLGRYKGEEVLHPLGWDAFGLPAENAAIQNQRQPAEWTAANIDRMRNEQLARAGFSFDLDLELNTSSPLYYQWTQWLFLKLYEHGQIDRQQSWVNWDPVDQTVLANEQVIDGKGWRSGAPIERRLMEQWSIKITDYAEDLWNGLDTLDGWSERAVAAQRNWIGRSEGADIAFGVDGSDANIEVFTTRPDTLFGVTSLTLAPENPLVVQLTAPDRLDAVNEYVAAALKKSEVDRQAGLERSGVAIGRDAIHPLTGAAVPIYISDYVLGGYGTGAIMNVPAHEARDHDFARESGLPITTVVLPAEGANGEDGALFEDDGVLVNSGEFDGMSSADARRAITDAVEAAGKGRRVVRYRLRDWTVSRQRFWGAPIPMLHGEGGTFEPVPEADLPVKLPPEFAHIGKSAGEAQGSPLATDQDWLAALSPTTGEAMTREPDTMDTFMCSAWYAWRFLDPTSEAIAWQPERAERWMPIDYYIGGLEHANQHLIYFRYISRFLHSIGLTPTPEPVARFLDNGMVRLGGHKMSKSRGNTITPTEIIDRTGADALRLYIASDTPFERDRDWDDSGLEAKQRFLARVYSAYGRWALPRGVLDEAPEAGEAGTQLMRAMLAALAQAAEAIDERRSFHTAVAAIHSAFNLLADAAKDESIEPAARAYAAQQFLKLLSLFAPHLADHLWRTHCSDSSIFAHRWPDTEALGSAAAETVTVAVQIGGKRRGELQLSPEASDDHVAAALEDTQEPTIRNQLDGKTIRKLIVVRTPDGAPKLVNVVV